MNRRKFINRSAVAGAGIATGASILSCDDNVKNSKDNNSAFAKAQQKLHYV